MTIIILPQEMANRVRSGYIAAVDIIKYLVREQGFSKPAGKSFEEINLSMLKRGGYKIQSAKFDIVAGTMHLELT